MCGIYIKIGKNIIPELFEEKLSLLKHRGPDDIGVTHLEGISLGQTRLAIIDLSKDGHQPMISRCGRYQIVYNGEVYNFLEIRKELEKLGFVFRSHSDTEVILNGFIAFGDAIVEKLNGMFAFVIHDLQDARTFIARDRFGIKPLYCRHVGDTLELASELKILKSESSEVSLEAKIKFLLLGYIPEPQTIYSDITQFPVGHFAWFEDGKLNLTRYHLLEFRKKLSISYSEAVEETRNLLDKAIASQLISDAPIGAFLSGGVDSSVICAIASLHKKDIKTLSLFFAEQQYSEKAYQELVVEKFKLQYDSLEVSESYFLDVFDDFYTTIEQPTIDGLNTFLVSKVAIDSGLTTVLSGVGGDELFYGYASFKRAKTLKSIRRYLPMAWRASKFRRFKKLEFLQLDNQYGDYLVSRALFTPMQVAKMLDLDPAYVFNVAVQMTQGFGETATDNEIDFVGECELSLYMKNQLLRDSDVFSMANSLEIRVPFLDNNLVDFLCQIDPSYKFGKFNKNLLVEASRDLLPKQVYDRKKMGFELPFEVWIRSNLHKFDFDQNIKDDFSKGRISWSRAWAGIVSNKFI